MKIRYIKGGVLGYIQFILTWTLDIWDSGHTPACVRSETLVSAADSGDSWVLTQVVQIRLQVPVWLISA